MRKLISLNISEKNRNKVKVIFTGHIDHKGLLESDNSQYLDEQWKRAKSPLKSLLVTKSEEFVQYIEKFKLSQMKAGMVAELEKRRMSKEHGIQMWRNQPIIYLKA